MENHREKTPPDVEEGPRDFTLADLLDLHELQKIQDAFARATGIASTISDPYGNPITQPSNHSTVCRIVRSTAKGLARCQASARVLGETSRKKMCPNFAPCRSVGFIDASAPILVEGRHVANWLIGQNFVGTVTEGRVAEYANEIGADPEEMVDAFRKMPKIDESRFREILEFLWLMANQISALGYRNLKMEQLVAELEESSRDLFRAKKDLEIQVNERTLELKKALEEVQKLSEIDALTGCFNRGYIDRRLPGEVKRCRRYNRPLSLILGDIDHFKRINDRFGHQAGDETLRQVGQCFQSVIRSEVDWVGRYGGEEFLVVLPETPAAGAKRVAERLRRAVGTCRLVFHAVSIRISASFGVSSMEPGSREPSAEMEHLLSRADACLYMAKDRGRDQVVVEANETFPNGDVCFLTILDRSPDGNVPGKKRKKPGL